MYSRNKQAGKYGESFARYNARVGFVPHDTLLLPATAQEAVEAGLCYTITEGGVYGYRSNLDASAP